MQRITVILPNNLGDVIMALPVLDGLKSAHTAARITFVVEEGYEGGLLNSPFCDRIVSIQRKSIKQSSFTGQWNTGIALLRALLEECGIDGEDTVINLSQHSYVSYLATLFGAPVTLGRRFLREGNHALSDRWSQYLYTIPFARNYNHLHATDVYCRIAGVKSGRERDFITITPQERDFCRTYLVERNFPTDRPVAVLQPGAAWPAKRWPAGSFITLGKLLIADGYEIIITGAPSERDTADYIAGELGAHCLATAGVLTFRETIALLTFVNVVVSGDTAIMHAAAALGTRVVAIFGPTSPVETGPYGSGHTVLCGTCPLRPCFKTECADCRCMASVAPETVYGCINNIMAGNAGCDILTTAFSDGDYGLIPDGRGSQPYYDPGGAALTRTAFEPAYPNFSAEATAPEVVQSRRFIQQCVLMEQALTACRAGGGGALLGRFEQVRNEAAQGEGITAFWTALLNIRLNSIALLNPVAGIDDSISACRTTRLQIAGVLTV
jgi:heptosyltransferase-1